VAPLLLFGGCKDDSKSKPAATASSSSGPAKVVLTLDWKPEPEFGGFYAAKQNGDFEKNGLDVTLKPAGAGAPMWQRVATNQTEFATTAADQVIIARSSGADVMAIFAVYQDCPQAVMTHKSRGFTKLQDVFANTGTLAAENNVWLRFCQSKFSPVKVTITGYAGGVAGFLADKNYSQQCFVFSEPILAKKQDPASDPQTFLVAESGYNPYTTVVIASGETVRTHPARVKGMIDACRAGWRAYLDDAGPANKSMQELNRDMDPETFAKAAEAQKPLIENEQTKQAGLGSMTAERWTKLAQQLVKLGVVKDAPPARQCYVDEETLK
jgi:NitT/TauT family transport system substrate-binding protein